MPNTTPKVLVISMEKAGSTTVMHAIKSAGFEVGRVHRHNVNKISYDDYTHFVVMVRDPIARAISNYFETHKAISLKEEIEFSLGFFDSCVLPITNIDVMSLPYAGGWNGWEIFYDKLLVICVKDFNNYLADALSVLLGKPSLAFAVIHHPKGYERFGTEYTRFIDEAEFSQSFLDKVYQSAYCRRFGYCDMGEWQRET